MRLLTHLAFELGLLHWIEQSRVLFVSPTDQFKRPLKCWFGQESEPTRSGDNFNLRKRTSTNHLSKRFQVALKPASKSTDPVVAIVTSLILTAVDAPDVFGNVFVFLDGASTFVDEFQNEARNTTLQFLFLRSPFPNNPCPSLFTPVFWNFSCFPSVCLYVYRNHCHYESVVMQCKV